MFAHVVVVLSTSTPAQIQGLNLWQGDGLPGDCAFAQVCILAMAFGGNGMICSEFGLPSHRHQHMSTGERQSLARRYWYVLVLLEVYLIRFNKSYSTEVQGAKHAVDSNRFNAASNQVEMFLTSLLSIPLARGPVVDVAVDRHFVYSLGEVGPMLTSSAT